MWRPWRDLLAKTRRPAAGRQARRKRPRSPSRVKLALEALEERLTPTIYLNPGIAGYQVYSYAGVGLRENVVAAMTGTSGGITDTNASDFHAFINWGDGAWVPADIAPNTGGRVDATFLIKGSHVYDHAVLSQPVQVQVTGPDDPTPVTAQTAQVSVSDMPSAIPGTPPPPVTASLPPSNVDVSLNPGIAGYQVFSYTDVGLRENVVAALSGTANGVTDTSAGDFHAFINWGDDNQWYPADIVPNEGGRVDATFLVKGTHVYDRAVSPDDPYHVVVFATGPDGTSASGETARASVSDMPSGIQGTAPPDAPTSLPPSNVDLYLNPGIAGYQVFSYTDVGLRENVVAALSGTVNGVNDTRASDFHAFINWGDDNQWYPADIAPNDGGRVDATFLVKGTHVYDRAVSPADPYHVVVFVLGPDGTSASGETARASVSDMPSGIPGTPPPEVASSTPPSNVDLSLNPGIADYQVFSYTGVGFRENVVAALSDTVNGVADTNKGDFHAFINWGDSDQWYPADIAPNTGGPVDAPFLIKGTYVYDHAVAPDDPYHVVIFVLGPDGTSASGETARASVSDMSSGIPGTPPPPVAYSLSPSNVDVYLNAGIPDYQLFLDTGDGTTQNVVASLSGTVNGVTDTNAGDFHAFINWGDDNQWYAGKVAPNTSGASATFLVEGSHPYEQGSSPSAPFPVVVFVMGPDGTSTSGQTAEASVTAPPLEATSITWHTNADDGGGVDLGYRVNGGPLAADNALTVYWSDETTFDPNNPNQEEADSITVPAGTAAGPHTVQVTAAELGQPLPGTNQLLLVVDPPGVVAAVAASDVNAGDVFSSNATDEPQALHLPCGPTDILSPVPSSSGTGMVPPITLQLGSSGGSAPVPGLLDVGEIDAVFQPAGGAMQISQAAVICGVAHFNWTQMVEQVPIQWTYYSYQTGLQQQVSPRFPDAVPYLRKVTSSTFPPLASTPYADPLRQPQALSSRSEPLGDNYGFYWNESPATIWFYDPDMNSFQGGMNKYTTSRLYNISELNPNLNTFKFEDRPELPRFTINGTSYSYYLAGAANQFIGFQTTLVGVDANHQLVNLPNLSDLTFSWKDNATFMGMPYTNILGGAYFGDALDPNEPPTTAGGVFGVRLNLGQAVNHAPSWAGGGAVFTAVAAGATDPAGDSVASVFGSSFSDADGDLVGVAVTGLTGTGNGTWQYSLDAGMTWTGFGAVSAGSARLLSATDLVRFVPDAGFTGTATLQAFAWDQTAGTDGGTADLSGAGSTGGSTAFSTTALTATVQVTAAAPPTSSVTALPAATDSVPFTVSWSGSPSAPGLSIAGYTVYVSDNGGPFTAWQRNTTATSASYTGQDGHTYAFYSVATDSAGDVQLTPAAAQATTLVDLDPPTSSVNPLPAVMSSPSFTVSWSGDDNSGGSGLYAFDVFVSVDGGAFQPWLTGTTQTSAAYTGALGHSYGFASVATDNAGNRQAGPTAAQAETTLVQPPPPPVTAHPISAQLLSVKVRRRRRLMVEVFDAATGALKEKFLSPFQSPAFQAIQVNVRDSNGDGVPDEVVLTARRGRHTVTQDFAG